MIARTASKALGSANLPRLIIAFSWASRSPSYRILSNISTSCIVNVPHLQSIHQPHSHSVHLAFKNGILSPHVAPDGGARQPAKRLRRPGDGAAVDEEHVGQFGALPGDQLR